MGKRLQIKHVIVLMLENRSFDHMLGFLDHPKPTEFPGIGKGHGVTCPEDPLQDDSLYIPATPDAEWDLGVGPGHSHRGAMTQIFGTFPGRAGTKTMTGFVRNFQDEVNREWDGSGPELDGTHIMRCFAPAKIPVLAKLAREYAVFTRWHASVPGETWPNRNFAHAATSRGKVNIAKRFYPDRTIFEQLSDAGKKWRIYHDGVPQVIVFHKVSRHRLGRFRPTRRLLEQIADDDLPTYAFVEPDHGFGPGQGNSQHPDNNKSSEASFLGGEALIAAIYNALVENPTVFAKTLFLVTYDEHGGFFDHVDPLTTVPPDKRRAKEGFDFRISGVRVPTVAVSPLIPAGTIITDPFEHASIPHTLRVQYARDQRPLNERDSAAGDFIATLPLLDEARKQLTKADPIQQRASDDRFRWLIPDSGSQLNELEASLLELASASLNELDRPPHPGIPAFRPSQDARDAADHRSIRAPSSALEQANELVQRLHTRI